MKDRKYRISRIYEYRRCDGSIFRVFVNLQNETIGCDCEDINREFENLTYGHVSFEKIISPLKESDFNCSLDYELYLSSHFKRTLMRLCHPAYKVIEVYSDGSFFIVFDKDCHPGEIERVIVHDPDYNWSWIRKGEDDKEKEEDNKEKDDVKEEEEKEEEKKKKKMRMMVGWEKKKKEHPV